MIWILAVSGALAAQRAFVLALENGASIESSKGAVQAAAPSGQMVFPKHALAPTDVLVVPRGSSVQLMVDGQPSTLLVAGRYTLADLSAPVATGPTDGGALGGIRSARRDEHVVAATRGDSDGPLLAPLPGASTDRVRVLRWTCSGAPEPILIQDLDSGAPLDMLTGCGRAELSAPLTAPGRYAVLLREQSYPFVVAQEDEQAAIRGALGAPETAAGTVPDASAEPALRDGALLCAGGWRGAAVARFAELEAPSSVDLLRWAAAGCPGLEDTPKASP